MTPDIPILRTEAGSTGALHLKTIAIFLCGLNVLDQKLAFTSNGDEVVHFDDIPGVLHNVPVDAHHTIANSFTHFAAGEAKSG